MMIKQERQTNLDLLKLCAFACVVCLHVAAKPWQVLSVDTFEWQIANAFRSTWGVPVFVMVSGRFLLDSTRKVDAGKLRHYLTRVITAFVFWSAFYEWYQLCVAYPSRGVTQIDWKWEVVEFMTGEYHLWYLVMLAGLYLVTPFLRKICQDKQLVRWYLVLFFASETLSCYGVSLPKVGVLINPLVSNMCFRFAMGYTGYLVLGYFLASETISARAERWIYVLGVLSLIITPLANGWYALQLGERTGFFSGNLAPNIIIASAAIYVFFCKRVSRIAFNPRVSHVISELEKLGFGAYLIHVLFINLTVDFIGIEFINNNPVLWIPVLSILIAVVSLGCAAVLRKIPVIGNYIA